MLMLGFKGLNFNTKLSTLYSELYIPHKTLFLSPPPHHANNLHQCGFLFLLLSKLLSPKTVKNKV